MAGVSNEVEALVLGSGGSSRDRGRRRGEYVAMISVDLDASNAGSMMEVVNKSCKRFMASVDDRAREIRLLHAAKEMVAKLVDGSMMEAGTDRRIRRKRE